MKPYLQSTRSPIPFAHRGGAMVWPENTDLSFRGAIELGYRYIETDVHLTRDGVLVCHHDDTLDRTSNASGPVTARTLKELRQLDFGHRFTLDEGRSHPHRGRGARILTLDEALDLHPDVRWNVEMKTGGDAMVAAMWRFLERRRAFDRVLVAASDHALGDRFRAIAGGRCATSPGVAGVIAFYRDVQLGIAGRRRYAYDALQVPEAHGGLRVVTPRFVRAAHTAGLAVHVWTIDDEPVIRRLVDLGVDGIMTDRPKRLLRVLDAVGAG